MDRLCFQPVYEEYCPRYEYWRVISVKRIGLSFRISNDPCVTIFDGRIFSLFPLGLFTYL